MNIITGPDSAPDTECAAVAWVVFDSKQDRYVIFNRELASAIAEQGLLTLAVFGQYEWLDAKVQTWKPINRLPYTWERELGIQWRVSTTTEGGWDGQAYASMADELEAWKQRAIAAEADVTRLYAEFNAENGPTFMGEPVLTAALSASTHPRGGEIALRFPWGSWSANGTWQYNPLLQMSEAAQRAKNIENGYLPATHPEPTANPSSADLVGEDGWVRGENGLPINDAIPAPTQIQPGNLFLWNWQAMQEYALTCIAALSPPPRTAGVTDAEVGAACEAFYVDTAWKDNHNRAFDFMRIALVAAAGARQGDAP